MNERLFSNYIDDIKIDDSQIKSEKTNKNSFLPLNRLDKSKNNIINKANKNKNSKKLKNKISNFSNMSDAESNSNNEIQHQVTDFQINDKF